MNNFLQPVVKEITLRYYQEDAVRETFKYINGGGTAGLCVMPTASGKAFSLCEIIKRILVAKNHIRIMNLTHVKELIQQNYDSLKELWPTAPAGIYSSSIGFKQFQHPIIFGGIQSCYRKPELFKHIDMLIIDEAHLVSENAESMYGSFIAALKEVNPNLVVIGFTATPYRLKMGYLTEGPIFDDIYYDISTMDEFVKLIDEGYLCDLQPISTSQQYDLSEVKKIAGDFSEKSLDENINLDKITREVVAETMMRAQGRNKGIAFCVSIDHANNMANLFREAGLRAIAVNGTMGKTERSDIMSKYKSGEYNMLTNVGVATTGLDVPDIDYIVNSRPTQSTALHVQMLGRGMRVHKSKTNTLVLDFAGNTERLGPINDPVVPMKKGEGGDGEAPVRVCRQEALKPVEDGVRPNGCGFINHASVRHCKGCGYEFNDPEIKVSAVVRQDELIKRKDVPNIREFNVDKVDIVMHNSRAGNQVVKIIFFSGHYLFERFLMFEKSSKGRHPSLAFWNKLGMKDQPKSNQEAFDKLNSDLTKPDRIKVWMNKPVRGKTTKVKDIMEVIYDARG